MSNTAASPASPALPADLAAAHAMILSERAMRIEAQAAASSVEATIAHLKLMIEKLRRELYGQRSDTSKNPVIAGFSRRFDATRSFGVIGLAFW